MTSIFSFPFEQIGQGLRALSLSGTFGNIVAILLYTALSISPVLYMAYRKRKGRLIREDFFLPFISLCLFVGIYIYINPGYLRNFVAPFAVSDSYLLAIGSTLWSIIICYVVFRILHDVEHKESIDLLRLMQNLLIIIILLVIWNILGPGLLSLITEIKETAAGNTADAFFSELYTENSFFDGNLNVTCFWLILKYLLDCIPSLLLLWLLFLAKRVVRTLQKDSFSETVIVLCQELGIRCRNIVIVICVLTVAENILQLLCSHFLLTTYYQITIPIYTLLLVFVILLFSKKLSESRTLKLDNDSII